MANEIFDDPFQPVDQVAKKDSCTERFMSLSSSDFRLIQRKLDGAEASMGRSLDEQAANFNNTIGDLKEEFKGLPKTIETYPLTGWFEEDFFETKKLVYVPMV